MARADIQIKAANIAVATKVTKRIELMIQHTKKINNYSQNMQIDNCVFGDYSIVLCYMLLSTCDNF